LPDLIWSGYIFENTSLESRKEFFSSIGDSEGHEKMNQKTKLSVNVNKIATLRNSRGKNLPDVLKTSLDLIRFGAEGITVHPRPDGRHIRSQDVYDLKKHISVELNVEGYPSEDFLNMCLEVEPAQCTLVPDPPEALTSQAGFEVSKQSKLLEMAISRLKQKNIRTSVFVENNLTAKDFQLLKKMGCARVELYTEEYADGFGTSQQATVMQKYLKTAELALASGLGLNAGHDLNLKNLVFLKQQIPEVLEVSIGHALICDALYYGFEATIKKYLQCLA